MHEIYSHPAITILIVAWICSAIVSIATRDSRVLVIPGTLTVLYGFYRFIIS